ncbi:hypothetical protein GUITHDRAFT_114849 [Guillardia theta CCMP2712]|uniref:Uncharacterized protein n=1 Tax=Guillardia theta (strain CCMP2712) TaxID=905079 RepID=L1IST4_GUITC|nr:hypothetical protein GUITHDRAFT_114849 [Guillardia theta CCMP2712]EKX38969.1 hypothetical protein GUITHDRAFT_114849 [Guillardia theta CCMP2712]|eukprot:XP_005825949.1 hypothetical protein GUITHDRAFT_114849 [Guillardia theta CCMP2712]
MSVPILPFQVCWRGDGKVQHEEFERREDAIAFYESVPSCTAKRLTEEGVEVCLECGGGRWEEDWTPDHPSSYISLRAFLTEEEMNVLGDLARRARVKFDRSMGIGAHGRSLRCERTLVPLCLVNPSTPDKRYVILHELMHHQLDDLGCPCLSCPLLHIDERGRRRIGDAPIPDGCWLEMIDNKVDPTFLPNTVQIVWELIQHSRFNPFLDKNFSSRAHTARDKSLKELLRGDALLSYCNPKTDPHPVRRVMMAIQYATAKLEGSMPVLSWFRKMLKQEGATGEDIIELGEAISNQIHVVDVDVCRLEEEEAEAVMAGMLLDLKRVLSLLIPDFVVDLKGMQPLPSCHENRSRFITNLNIELRR